MALLKINCAPNLLIGLRGTGGSRDRCKHSARALRYEKKSTSSKLWMVRGSTSSLRIFSETSGFACEINKFWRRMRTNRASLAWLDRTNFCSLHLKVSVIHPQEQENLSEKHQETAFWGLTAGNELLCTREVFQTSRFMSTSLHFALCSKSIIRAL